MKKLQLGLRCSVVIALTAFFATPPLQAQAVPAEAPAVLNVGDAVRVTVWRNPDLSGEFVVGESGTLTHPLYRDLAVAGVPVSRLDTDFATLLRRFDTTPEFVVEPLFRIPVTGQVRQPNVYNVPSYMTVAQAVMLAGGTVEQARADRVRLIRNGTEYLVDLTNSEAPSYNLRVRSGDQLVVDRRRGGVGFWDVISMVGTLASVANLVRYLR
ncbi:MAG: SLBB domain-containing protein [Gemmatimonadetes bacterium]|nr:SLBB domain-containing protein [Gemmatimonadota bacterium]